MTPGPPPAATAGDTGRKAPRPTATGRPHGGAHGPPGKGHGRHATTTPQRGRDGRPTTPQRGRQGPRRTPRAPDGRTKDHPRRGVLVRGTPRRKTARAPAGRTPRDTTPTDATGRPRPQGRERTTGPRTGRPPRPRKAPPTPPGHRERGSGPRGPRPQGPRRKAGRGRRDGHRDRDGTPPQRATPETAGAGGSCARTERPNGLNDGRRDPLAKPIIVKASIRDNGKDNNRNERDGRPNGRAQVKPR